MAVTKAAEPSRKCKRCYSGLENSNASFAIAALISELNSVRRFGGDMVLRAPRAAVRRTIELVGLDRALPILD